jgi:hypothetical protein
MDGTGCKVEKSSRVKKSSRGVCGRDTPDDKHLSDGAPHTCVGNNLAKGRVSCTDNGDNMPVIRGVMSVASACAGRYQCNTPKPHVITLLVGPLIGPHDTSGLREAVGIRIAAEGTGENTVMEMDDKGTAGSPS